jgi:glycyl-tRNA synthetase beta chain
MPQDLLLEIGVEELPAGFVAGALAALPELVATALAGLRLGHGAIRALGTPRRLAVIVEAVAEQQPDLDEEIQGPPARIAFDAEGKPTKAAESFAQKSGVALEALRRVSTPKGDYVAARRLEPGRPAIDLLPAALAAVCGKIPFKKSMRWGEGETPFGRPVRWLVALFGETTLPFEFAGITSGAVSAGHRFLGAREVAIAGARDYVAALRGEHVLVDGEERSRVMMERLRAAAQALGGTLIEDEFLVGENLSLVEEPQIVAGGFERRFLELPEHVILDVAKGHQRYFGVRAPDGSLMPAYLAVVNTARAPDKVRRGNDRVMRARLSDARFFWDEDAKHPLASRRPKLDGIVFQKRLGSVGDKVRRIERALPALARLVDESPATLEQALAGAALAKCDLVTLMVGELPELQGEMGLAYAAREGIAEPVRNVIFEHYLPRGASDGTAPSAAGALVAIADRLDSLVGCFAIGLVPSGSADPLALRRAALGVLRTVEARRWDLALSDAIRAVFASYEGVALDLDVEAVGERLGGFFRDRLRAWLAASQPGDVVDACLAAGADRPADVVQRVRALASIDPEVRAKAGEVFKRAMNIAKDAPAGAPSAPASLNGELHPSEAALWSAWEGLGRGLDAAGRDYAAALHAIEAFQPTLSRFFEDVLVMAEDPAVRDNRLRWMRALGERCSSLAHFNLLSRPTA